MMLCTGGLQQLWRQLGAQKLGQGAGHDGGGAVWMGVDPQQLIEHVGAHVGEQAPGQVPMIGTGTATGIFI